MSLLKAVAAPFQLALGGHLCETSLGDYQVALVDGGAVYAMRCRPPGPCPDCVEVPLYPGLAARIPQRLHHCMGCLLAELFNAGLLNLVVEGRVLLQPGAYVVRAMRKERDDPERLAKRAGGILENEAAKVVLLSVGPCCR